MKLRFVIIIISLIAILATAVGSYFHYTTLKNNTEQQINSLAAEELADIDRHVSGYIGSSHVAVKHLAENINIRHFLTNQQLESELAKADVVLDNFHKATDSSVVYLMNNDGVTIASSNRHSPDSFVGKNYAFRPYFIQAITGKPSVFLALGKTSGKRGIYFSQPIYGSTTDSPVGVAIIKYPITRITDWFTSKNFSGDIFFHDPQGVIFVSTVQDSLYKTLWKLSSEQIADIVTSEQFGSGPFEWSGLKKNNDNQIVDSAGDLLMFHQQEIAALPGWGLILKHNHESIIRSLHGQFFQFWRYILLAVCVLVGAAVLYLSRIGSDSITRLHRAEEKYRTLFEGSRDAIMTLDPSTLSFTSGNPAALELFKVEDKAHLISLGLWHLSPETQPDGKPSSEKAKEMLETAMRNGSHFFQWTHCHADGTSFPAEILLTRMEQDGQVFLQATARDITERIKVEAEREKLIAKLQNALSEIKTLQGIIPICMYCHKIKAELGDWNKLETYIQRHSNADFSHGICPECYEKQLEEVEKIKGD